MRSMDPHVDQKQISAKRVVMQIPSNMFPPPSTSAQQLASQLPSQIDAPPSEAREAFHDFVGQTLFGQMLASMRKTVEKPAYLHGGQAEEIFQSQLDQLLVEDITDASAASIADPMYELFTLRRG